MLARKSIGTFLAGVLLLPGMAGCNTKGDVRGLTSGTGGASVDEAGEGLGSAGEGGLGTAGEAGDGGGSGEGGSGGPGSGESSGDGMVADGDEGPEECEPFCERLDAPIDDVLLAECGGGEAQLDVIPPNVMLVLDRSGTMNATFSGSAVRRYDGLYNVVRDLVLEFDTRMNLGMNFFPGLAGGMSQFCFVDTNVEVPVAAMNAGTILTVLPTPADPNSTAGGTPAVVALRVAIDHLTTLDPSVPRAMIYVTDGAPGCNSGHRGLEEVAELLDQSFTALKIPTYVVGIDVQPDFTTPPSNGVTFADVAVAGGVPAPTPSKFYRATDTAELVSALDEIATSIQSCVANLDPPPDEPDRVRLTVDGMTVPRITDCATQDGWTYVDDDFDQAILCGSYCEDLKADGGQIEAKFGCPPAG